MLNGDLEAFTGVKYVTEVKGKTTVDFEDFLYGYLNIIPAGMLEMELKSVDFYEKVLGHIEDVTATKEKEI